MAADTEISMEADPGTFDVVKLQDYMELGVNRVSIGVQAFQQVRLSHSESTGALYTSQKSLCWRYLFQQMLPALRKGKKQEDCYVRVIFIMAKSFVRV